MNTNYQDIENIDEDDEYNNNNEDSIKSSVSQDMFKDIDNQ